jgi:general secretion pathway protein G
MVPWYCVAAASAGGARGGRSCTVSRPEIPMSSPLRRNAFTLIEVLIVVIIMAILAATIIPQFSTSTSDAKKSSPKFNVQTISTQIQLYKVQHNGTLPTFAALANQMTLPTDVTGATTGTNLIYGPYIQGQIPANPYTGASTVVKVATAGTIPTAIVTGGAGWQYDETTGGFFANNTEAYQAGF